MTEIYAATAEALREVFCLSARGAFVPLRDSSGDLSFSWTLVDGGPRPYIRISSTHFPNLSRDYVRALFEMGVIPTPSPGHFIDYPHLDIPLRCPLIPPVTAAWARVHGNLTKLGFSE